MMKQKCNRCKVCEHILIKKKQYCIDNCLC